MFHRRKDPVCGTDSKAGEGEEGEEGTSSRRVQEGKLTLLSGQWATAIVVMRMALMANLYTK